jgi:hypothetical protein
VLSWRSASEMRSAVLIGVILLKAAGCASIQAAATRDTLAAAGFSMQVADTPERVAELQSLPVRQLLSRSQGGVISYVFSDPAGCHCVYVGGEREYQEYQRLRRKKEADEESTRCINWPWCNGYGG